MKSVLKFVLLACFGISVMASFTFADENVKKSAADIFADAEYLCHLEVVGTKAGKDVGAALSGFVIESDGKDYIMTAGHIHEVGLAIKYIYAYPNLTATPPEEVYLIGYDHVFDVAILGFKKKDYKFPGKTAKLGSSAKLRVGDPVVTLGSPLGVPFSLGAGNVSNLTSLGVANGFTQPYIIMHTALTNPGNSGGPLVLMDGSDEVVGINVMVIRDSNNPLTAKPSVTNMYLSVPIDDAVSLLPKLVKVGEIAHPTVKAEFGNSWDYNPQDFKKEKMPVPAKPGVMVVKVEKDGPADKAGLKPGDIVLACNGQAPKIYNDLMRTILMQDSISVLLTFEILRGDEKLTLKVATMPLKIEDKD